MEKYDFDERLSQLIYGDLSPDEKSRIIAGLKVDGMTEEEIMSYVSVAGILDEYPVPDPSERMDRRFYAMLGEEKKKILLGSPDRYESKRSFFLSAWPLMKIAAGIALFILGFATASWINRTSQRNQNQMAQLSGEVKQLKETLVMSMMQQSSPVERIKAVNMISNMDDPESRVISSLLNVLNHDNNDNVRLLALEALIRYSGIKQVRDGLVTSLSHQTSPLIQMRLTDVLVALHETKALPEFRKMLNDESLNYSVRGKINKAVVILL
ncbi:MAG TPA: HEAT repeat domain-containing protein [Bacteroidales bacterium]|nr:HEAT repeat domain-containing protein [Bacteroidales bacterium]